MLSQIHIFNLRCDGIVYLVNKKQQHHLFFWLHLLRQTNKGFGVQVKEMEYLDCIVRIRGKVKEGTTLIIFLY